jgi:hypothetical protein
MPTYGPYYASSVADNGIGGGSWTNPQNAEGPSGAGTTCDPNETTNGLVAEAFLDASGNPINVNSTDTVNNVVCSVTRSASQHSSTKFVFDEHAWFLAGGEQAGNDLEENSDTEFNWPGTAAANGYNEAVAAGYITSLTPAQCNASNFGFFLQGGTSSSFTGSCSVFEFELYIYTTAAAGNVPVPLLPPGAMGLGAFPAGMVNQARRSRIEGVRFTYN